ncbi:MAG: monooxygenase [Salinisphaeraceae bacterium]|jgi:cation diffusion facilitator CzcD-associated flavoprotein CzcO|nr:monooxygenase [Salinisphaeraceae bacterium]
MSATAESTHLQSTAPKRVPAARRRKVTPDHETVIIGAGISGMGTAIELMRRGNNRFIILERARDVGGTWRDNRYPGVAVDITSFTYSYSFEQEPNWSRVFAPGTELNQYTRRVAAKYGVYKHIRFGVEIEQAEFDAEYHLWRISTTAGEQITARFVVSATGGLISPKLPDIEGLDSFKGKVIHTGRWDGEYSLKDKRVAVIGTGATAVQLIPKIAPEVAHLDVYQRTPIWVLKKPDGKIPAWLRTLFRWSPLLQRAVRMGTDALTEAVMVVALVQYRNMPGLVHWAERACLNNMREQLSERPDLWEKLTPAYGFGCKRPTFSNDYFQTYGRDNVDLVTAGIDRISEDGIIDKSGQERPVDVLILATGYRVFERGNLPSYEVWGSNRRELGEFWESERYQAYEGVTIPGYPNYFMQLGPYALLGSSYFKMVEGNAIHIGRCIDEAHRRGASMVEVRPDIHRRYFEDIQARQEQTVFLNHNCEASNSYYFDCNGDAPMLRPSTSMEMMWRAKHLSMDNYLYSERNRKRIVPND